jgi:hypothetical protein
MSDAGAIRHGAFDNSPYTHVGHRAVDLLGIRDENMIAALDEALERARALMDRRLAALVGGAPYKVFFHVYGGDAIRGPLEPLRHHLPPEVAVIVEVLAPDKDWAFEICSFVGHQLLFLPYRGRKATAGSLAHLVDTDPFDAGPAYEFPIDHPETTIAERSTDFPSVCGRHHAARQP